MPWDRKLYPQNWEAIAEAIKEEAGWTCEECGRPCRRPGTEWPDFVLKLMKVGSIWYRETCEEVIDEELGTSGVVEKPGRFVLTVAHLDHDPSNSDRANLKALCSPCHCRYDLKAMPLKKRMKAERNGQLRLPL